MSIKTILVAASGGTATAGAIEVGCRLARRFDAHLEGFHAKADPRELSNSSDGGFGLTLGAEFVNKFLGDTAALARKTKATFDAALAAHSIAAVAAPSNALTPKLTGASAAWHEETGHGPTLVASRARFFDLVVLGRSERVIDQPHTDAVEQTLVQSGRPVLLAPTKAPAEVGNTIVVGWNGSAEAVRALVAALPFLAVARHSFIVTIGDKHRDSAAFALDYLGWHGIAATYRPLPAIDGIGAGPQLLGVARERDADLLVMGSYGRMPWRESFFGGATRDVLEVGSLPLLLSH